MFIRIAAASIMLASISIAGASYGDEFQFKETRKLEHLIPERVPVPQHKPPVPYQPVHLSRLVHCMKLSAVPYALDIPVSFSQAELRMAALPVADNARKPLNAR